MTKIYVTANQARDRVIYRARQKGVRHQDLASIFGLYVTYIHKIYVRQSRLDRMTSAAIVQVSKEVAR